MIALNELHRLLRKTKLPNKRAFVVKELWDQTLLPLIRGATCAGVVDRGRVVVGSPEGLVCVDVELGTLSAVGGEKESRRAVELLRFLPEEHLLLAVAGRDRLLRLIPTSALSGKDTRWIKVDGTKVPPALPFLVSAPHACSMVTGSPRAGLWTGQGSRGALLRRRRQEGRLRLPRQQIRQPLREGPRARHARPPPGPPSLLPPMAQGKGRGLETLAMVGGKLMVGYPSGFRLWDLEDNAQAALLSLEDASLQFLTQGVQDAALIVEVHPPPAPLPPPSPTPGPSQVAPRKEYLLVFTRLGIYVDASGESRRHP